MKQKDEGGRMKDDFALRAIQPSRPFATCGRTFKGICEIFDRTPVNGRDKKQSRNARAILPRSSFILALQVILPLSSSFHVHRSSLSSSSAVA
jgi:hypothetical protein